MICTWTTEEVKYAVTKGFKIDEIYEVEQFNSKSDSLFTSYVQMFYETTGIKLDYSKIPEKQMKECIMFQNYSVMVYGVTNFIFLSENAVNVSYKRIEETLCAPTQTNIAVAAFTTAYARLRLLNALDLLGDKVIYMDTDSIVFVDELDEKNEWKFGMITGYSLGDFTDELGYDTFITEFVSTGPKSYAYKTNNGKKECCKVKGFNLKVHTEINFKSIKEIVLNDEKRNEKIDIKPKQFKISKYYDINTTKEVKQFGFTFDKRDIDFDNMNEYEINTLPFGYEK